MRVIGRGKIDEFCEKYPNAKKPLQKWETVMAHAHFSHFPDLKNTFRTADYHQPYTIFDIAGNHFRLIAIVVFVQGIVTIQDILTHADYTKRIKRGLL